MSTRLLALMVLCTLLEAVGLADGSDEWQWQSPGATSAGFDDSVKAEARHLLEGISANCEALAQLDLPHGVAGELAAIRAITRKLEVIVADASTLCTVPWARPLPEEQAEWEELCPYGGHLILQQICVAYVSAAKVPEWFIGCLHISDRGFLVTKLSGGAVDLLQHKSGGLKIEEQLDSRLVEWEDIVEFQRVEDDCSHGKVLRISTKQRIVFQLQVGMSVDSERLEKVWVFFAPWSHLDYPKAAVSDSHLPGVRVIVSSKRFLEHDLNAKRMLHVKGFDTGFKDATEDTKALEAEQDQECLDSLIKFCPDYLVVDGDPWGAGFQRHIQAFVDLQKNAGGKLPSLIWAKNLQMSAPLTEGGHPMDPAERSKGLQQAGEWAVQCGIPVLVYWIDAKQIVAKVNEMFRADASTVLEAGKFNARGLIHVLADPRPAWTAGLGEDMESAILAIEDPSRGEQQFFEKCSFENAAKGNVIFEVLDSPALQVHGSVTFGGGESVLLEFASKYLNSTSGFDADNTALFPHSRGRDNDPALPRHCGSIFNGPMYFRLFTE